MKNRKLGLAVVMAVMLSLFMVSSAMATPNVTNPYPTYDVQAYGPAVSVDISDFATSTNPDPGVEVTLSEFANYPCGGNIGDMQVSYTPEGFPGNAYTCVVWLTDGVGADALVPVTFNEIDTPVDEIEPVVDIVLPVDGSTVSATSAVVTYSATDNVGVVGCDVGNGSVVPLNNGLNSITVTCTDAAGNTGSDTVNVTSDTVEPVVTITAPANGTTFTVNAANLTFGVTDDQDQIPTCDKTSGVDVTLILGDNTITVTCTDEAGNVGSASVNVTYAPPVAQDRVRISLGNVIIREGDVNKVAYVPITLSAAYGVPITLSYNTQQVQGRGGATSGVDYVAAENELVTIPAGQTSWEIPITIIGDDSRESSENFFVIGDLTIESDAFAILVKDKATVVITNDDRSGCSDGFNHRHSGHDDNHNGRDDGHED